MDLYSIATDNSSYCIKDFQEYLKNIEKENESYKSNIYNAIGLFSIKINQLTQEDEYLYEKEFILAIQNWMSKYNIKEPIELYEKLLNLGKQRDENENQKYEIEKQIDEINQINYTCHICYSNNKCNLYVCGHYVCYECFAKNGCPFRCKN